MLNKIVSLSTLFIASYICASDNLPKNFCLQQHDWPTLQESQAQLKKKDGHQKIATPTNTQQSAASNAQAMKSQSSGTEKLDLNDIKKACHMIRLDSYDTKNIVDFLTNPERRKALEVKKASGKYKSRTPSDPSYINDLEALHKKRTAEENALCYSRYEKQFWKRIVDIIRNPQSPLITTKEIRNTINKLNIDLADRNRLTAEFLRRKNEYDSDLDWYAE